MKHLFYSIFLITVTLFLTMDDLSAQTVNVDFEPARKLEQPSGASEPEYSVYLTEDNNHIYESVFKGMLLSSRSIRKKDKVNHTIVWEKNIPIDKKEKADPVNFIKLEIGYLLFLKKEDKGKITYLGQKLDESFNLVGAMKPLTEPRIIKETTFSKHFLNVERFGGQFLLYGMYSDEKSSSQNHHLKNEPFSFSVIDSDLTIVWQTSVEMAKDRYFRMEKAYLDKEQNLISVFNQSVNEEKTSSEEQNNKLVIVKYDQKLKQLTYDNIKWPENIRYYDIQWSSLDQDSDIRLNIAGVYHNENKSTRSHGLFKVSINATNSLSEPNIVIIPYSNEIIERFKGAKIAEKKRNGKPLESVHINTLFTNNGKSIFIIQEIDSAMQMITPGSQLNPNAYSYPSPMSNNRAQNMMNDYNQTFKPGSGFSVTSAPAKYTYRCNNIVTIQTSETGQIEWTHVIKRTAKGPKFQYLTSYSFLSNNVVYTLFNADVKSTLKSPQPEEYVCRVGMNTDQVLCVIGIDQEGKQVETQHISTPDKNDFACIPMKTHLGKNNAYKLEFDDTALIGNVRRKVSAILSVK
ncbi:MAG: hypothetical protein V4590_10145 [Bacteroidota bacterium]